MLLRYGQEQTIRGQLKTLDGSPLADATVTVTATAAGWPARALATVVTDANGRFAYRVPAVASETVSFAYQGTDTLREIVQTAVIRVIGSARLHVARPAVAGQPILFAGRVLGGFIPPGGALVQLEYRIKGVPVDFAPFGPLIHTNRQGRFGFRRPMATNAARLHLPVQSCRRAAERLAVPDDHHQHSLPTRPPPEHGSSPRRRRRRHR